MAIIKIEDLKRIRKKHKYENLVLCSGTFDLTHVGHILFFEDCKKLGDVLVVGVAKDYAIRISKGDNRPILNENIRIKTIDSLKPVDYVILNGAKKDNLLSDLEILMEKLKPDIYAINEDGFNLENRQALCKKYSIDIKVMPRYCPKEYESISTTSIIEKIRKS